jgi:hypothetical protein
LPLQKKLHWCVLGWSKLQQLTKTAYTPAQSDLCDPNLRVLLAIQLVSAARASLGAGNPLINGVFFFAMASKGFMPFLALSRVPQLVLVAVDVQGLVVRKAHCTELAV